MGKSKYSRLKKEYKISEKLAIDNLMLFLDYYDIDIDAIEEKSLKNITETVFNKIVNYIRDGLIKVEKDDNGIRIIQTLTNGKDKLVYQGIKGEHKISMDGYDENYNHHKMFALAGALSGIGEAGIHKLEGTDLSVAECIAFVFLQV